MYDCEAFHLKRCLFTLLLNLPYEDQAYCYFVLIIEPNKIDRKTCQQAGNAEDACGGSR